MGGNLRYTSTGAVATVPDILPTGMPASGDIWSLSMQLIGTNLYSVRDIHVLIANFLHGPTFQGHLVSCNNASCRRRPSNRKSNVENSKTSGPTRNESSSRTFFYVGGRYDFRVHTLALPRDDRLPAQAAPAVA